MYFENGESHLDLYAKVARASPGWAMVPAASVSGICGADMIAKQAVSEGPRTMVVWGMMTIHRYDTEF